jgi:hypothetical protein
MKHVLLLTTLFCLAAPTLVSAQFTVNLDPTTARFTYFPPSEGPGIPQGVPHPFELHFGMQGTFTIEELPNNQGDITQAAFTLLGNEGLLQSDPQRWAGIEEYARFLLLESAFSVEHGPPLDRTVFRAQFDDFFGDDLVLQFFRDTLVRMDGGPDYRPSDGHAAHYAFPIPEPGGVVLAIAACSWTGFWWIGRRRRARQ